MADKVETEEPSRLEKLLELTQFFTKDALEDMGKIQLESFDAETCIESIWENLQDPRGDGRERMSLSDSIEAVIDAYKELTEFAEENGEGIDRLYGAMKQLEGSTGEAE